MDGFNIMFVVVLIFIAIMFVITIGSVFSPKIRSKFLGRQLKIQKRVLDDNKDLIKDISKTSSEIGINTISELVEENKESISNTIENSMNIGLNAKKNYIDKNSDILKDLSSKQADIESISLEKKASAIRNGLKGSIYCKHCGENIDNDSSYCKYCGKKL